MNKYTYIFNIIYNMQLSQFYVDLHAFTSSYHFCIKWNKLNHEIIQALHHSDKHFCNNVFITMSFIIYNFLIRIHANKVRLHLCVLHKKVSFGFKNRQKI